MADRNRFDVGNIFPTSCGVCVVITNKIPGDVTHVEIMWLDSLRSVQVICRSGLLTGNIKNPCTDYDIRRKYNVGDILPSLKHGDFKILDARVSQRVVIMFVSTGTTLEAHSSTVCTGQINDPMQPTVYGVGFIGVGPYTPTIIGTRVKTKPYSIWASMVCRCYGEGTELYENYGKIGIHMVAAWHNFQTFAEWHTANCGQADLYVDKDLLKEGNNIYGPETCVCVPVYMNNIFNLANTNRSEMMLGVKKAPSKVTLTFYSSIGAKHNGTYNSEFLAHRAWQRSKIKAIIQHLRKYKEEKSFDKGLYTSVLIRAKRLWCAYKAKEVTTCL